MRQLTADTNTPNNTQLSRLSLLVCFPRSTALDQENEGCTKLRDALAAELGLHAVSLVPARVWWEQSFAAAGTYETWCREAVSGQDYWTRQPRFQAFVLVGSTIGRANGSIAQHALDAGRTVFHFAEDERLRVLTRLVPTHSGSWAAEWYAESTPIQSDD